ncbi:MAG TPA: hypothetical protein VF796_18200 [Humisphaera sp.]
MSDQDLEILIAAYADGTLAPERRPEAEAALRQDPAARAMLESYRAVDAALAGVARRQPVPNVRWDRFEAVLSRQVAALAARPTSTVTETEEENLSRLAAGELPATERGLVDAKLARDPHARLVLAEYAAVERGFEQVRAEPLPEVKWDALAAHLSNAVRDAADASAPETIKLPAARSADRAVAAKSGRRERASADARSLGRIDWAAVFRPRWIAAAACLALGTTIAVRVATQSGGDPGGVVRPELLGKTTQPAAKVDDTVAAAKPFTEIRVFETPIDGGPAAPVAMEVGVSRARGTTGPQTAIAEPSVGRESRSMVVSDKAAVIREADAQKPNATSEPAFWR